MKRFLTLVLALALCFNMLALTASAEETAEASLKITDEPATLTVFLPIEPNLQDYISDWNETPYFQALEQMTGVHVEFVQPAWSAAKETLNMLMVSGDMPDVIMCSNYYPSGSYQAVLDGYYIDIAPYLEEYAPDYWKLITQSDAVWRDAVNSNGIISSVYRIMTAPNPSWMRLVLKKETLDQLGVAEVPATIDDWDSLFSKMLAAGITPFMLEATGYDEKFIGAYNVRQDFYQEDGVVKYGQVQEGFRQYLELMHGWYEKGYISNDFVSASNNDTLFSVGDIGTYNKPVVAAFNFGKAEGYTVVSTPYPRQTKDQFLHWDSYKNSLVNKSLDFGNIAVSGSCKQVELAVKWLNFMYTDAGSTLANWGVEGQNYQVVDNQKQYLPVMWDYKGISQEGLNYYFKMHNMATITPPDTVCHANLLKNPEANAIRMEYDDDPLLDSALYLPDVSLTEEESETRTSVMTDIDIYVDEMVLKFIIGTEPLSNWDSYVKTVESMGLEDAIAATQAAYERYMTIGLEE
ncbi:MAG: extracellular solute-binding protein [Eubacteriales bacterium]|nr:extracellular solute-binding protein [Eubacteriales bacterium]